MGPINSAFIYLSGNLSMKVETLRIGMSVKHPYYGVGKIKAITEHTVDIAFDDKTRTISPDTAELQPAEPTVEVSGLDLPLAHFVRDTVERVINRLGLEKPESVVEELGARWNGGELVMQPADRGLQAKEVPMEVFFHKIVMMRNNLRVLEQKINAHAVLTDGEKVEMQQYITKCYGSMTTFNILFKHKDGQFGE